MPENKEMIKKQKGGACQRIHWHLHLDSRSESYRCLPGRAFNGHNWNMSAKIHTIVLDDNLKYKLNTHESILI